MAGQFGGDELRHAQQRTALEALGQADDRIQAAGTADVGQDGRNPCVGTPTTSRSASSWLLQVAVHSAPAAG